VPSTIWGLAKGIVVDQGSRIHTCFGQGVIGLSTSSSKVSRWSRRPRTDLIVFVTYWSLIQRTWRTLNVAHLRILFLGQSKMFFTRQFRSRGVLVHLKISTYLRLCALISSSLSVPFRLYPLSRLKPTSSWVITSSCTMSEFHAVCVTMGSTFESWYPPKHQLFQPCPAVHVDFEEMSLL